MVWYWGVALARSVHTSIAWLLVIYTAIDQAENCLVFYNYPPSAGYWDFICFHKELSVYWCLCCLSKENLVQQEHITSQNRYSYRVIPEQGNKLSVLTWRRRLHWWAEMEGLFSPFLTLSRGGILSIIHTQRCVVFCFWVNRTAYFSGSGSIWCYICFPEVLACAARNSSSCKKVVWVKCTRLSPHFFLLPVRFILTLLQL